MASCFIALDDNLVIFWIKERIGGAKIG